MAGKHWSLDDIPWDRFDVAAVQPTALAIVKAASLVERNAGDYVAYLCNIFADDPVFQSIIRRWGAEEVQHGEALGRWAELADPAFNFAECYQRFRARYRIPIEAMQSVRGSHAGEMVARCVVESGTSSLYSALRDGCREPVLRCICGKIAGDEFRHYRLFYRHLEACQDTKRLGVFRRACIAWRRFDETDDDELAVAYHCANMEDEPYDRRTASEAYARQVGRFYREEHIRRAVQMILKAVGLNPQARASRLVARLAWGHLQRHWHVGEAA